MEEEGLNPIDTPSKSHAWRWIVLVIVVVIILVFLALIVLNSYIYRKPTIMDEAKQMFENNSVYVASPEICYENSKYFNRSSCLQEVAVLIGNLSMCDKIETFYKWACYVGVAVRTKNYQICGMINPAPFMVVNNQTYRDSCYYSLAFDTKNLSLCSSVSDSKMQSICNRQVNAG